MIQGDCTLYEWEFQVTIIGAIEQEVNFIFDHLIVADFTMALYVSRWHNTRGQNGQCGGCKQDIQQLLKYPCDEQNTCHSHR